MMHIIRDCLLIMTGGAIGSLARYGTGVAAMKAFGKRFPVGHSDRQRLRMFCDGMVIEIILKLEAGPAEALTPAIRSQLGIWQKGVAVGFLGGFTTFSSFGGDTLSELHAGQFRLALTNVAANVVLSLIAVWCGMSLFQAVRT
jgi:fluoride exporter